MVKKKKKNDDKIDFSNTIVQIRGKIRNLWLLWSSRHLLTILCAILKWISPVSIIEFFRYIKIWRKKIQTVAFQVLDKISWRLSNFYLCFEKICSLRSVWAVGARWWNSRIVLRELSTPGLCFKKLNKTFYYYFIFIKI